MWITLGTGAEIIGLIVDHFRNRRRDQMLDWITFGTDAGVKSLIVDHFKNRRRDQRID